LINKLFQKRTVADVIDAMKTEENIAELKRYELIIVGMYTSSLLYMTAVANIIVRYSIERPNWHNYVLDSLVLLAVGMLVSYLSSLNSKTSVNIALISGLKAFILLFITVRFYHLVGPAVWTVAVIQLILSMFYITENTYKALLVSIFLAGAYIYHATFVSAPYQLGPIYLYVQLTMLVLLVIITSAIRKVIRDRQIILENKLQEIWEQKEEITALYEERTASEKKLLEVLEKLKKTQNQLIHQEKLAGIGQMAAGVAHEINNPLGYVSSNIQTAQQYSSQLKEARRFVLDYLLSLPPAAIDEHSEIIALIREQEEKFQVQFITEDMEEIFTDLEDGLKRISEIVLSLKMYSRADNTKGWNEYDLNAGIKNSLLVTRNELKHTAHVVEKLADIPLIHAKGAQINQVLLNLILNAIQAIKAKNGDGLGVLTVSTELAGDFVICRIEDDGCGIAESDIGNIFIPFFTTKPFGQGTGLGLSIAYDIIVNEHGGELMVESDQGVGTTLILKLPVAHNYEENGNACDE